MTNQLQEDLSEARFMVSFISLLSAETEGYGLAAEQMMNEVSLQDGFIAAYSARNEGGIGITNSYWSSIDAISKWKSNTSHQAIQKRGKDVWYQWYQLQVCKIQKNYGTDIVNPNKEELMNDKSS